MPIAAPMKPSATVPSEVNIEAIERAEQLSCLFVRFRGGYDRNVHAADLFHLIVSDFGEDKLFFQAYGIVAAAVERLIGYPSEVS